MTSSERDKKLGQIIFTLRFIIFSYCLMFDVGSKLWLFLVISTFNVRRKKHDFVGCSWVLPPRRHLPFPKEKKIFARGNSQKHTKSEQKQSLLVARRSHVRVGHFRVPKTLTFKMRLGAQLNFFFMRMKMISISKAELLPLFWNRGPGNSGMAYSIY